MIETKRYKHLIALAALILLALVAPKLWGLYSNPNFENYAAGAERKTAFFNYMLPLVQQQNKVITEQRASVLTWYEDRKNLSWWSLRQLEGLADKYKLDKFDVNNEQHWSKLKQRVDKVPPSLALAQAANESAWGTSRFAKKGNNYFGQWCYKPGCGIVPQKRGENEKHEVAAFDSPKGSVVSYMQNLNTHPSYLTLRKIRQSLQKSKQTVTGSSLLPGLLSYSTRGEKYTNELQSMIRQNKLEQYDR